MTIKTKHNWKTQSGLMVEAISELWICEDKISADGWETAATKKAVFTKFEIRVDGKRMSGYLDETLRIVKGVEYAANYGPLVISAENLAAIKELIAKTEAHPAMVAKRVAFTAGLKRDSEYSAHKSKIEKAMAE